jgi:hypothetical protein
METLHKVQSVRGLVERVPAIAGASAAPLEAAPIPRERLAVVVAGHVEACDERGVEQIAQLLQQRGVIFHPR